MKVSRIHQELKNAFSQYGIDGDQSLEYYGLVIQSGVCSSSKIYRQLSKTCDESSIIEKHKNLPFFQNVIRLAKIYDFSVRYNDEGNAFFRLVFAPFKKVLESEELFSELICLCHLEQYSFYFRKLIAYYNHIRFTGRSPLLKMGIELGENGNVLEAKAYFALKSYDDRYDPVGKRFCYTQCRHLVDKSLELLDMSDLSEAFAETARQLEKLEYYPVFTGINFSEQYIEMKVYYETCFSDYVFDRILVSENELSSLMLGQSDAELTLMHSEIQDMGAFIDCVSYSVLRYKSAKHSDITLWKPYYLALNDRLISTRIFERPQYDEMHPMNSDLESFKSVLLVSEQDEPQGFMQKQEAHKKGVLHRAFSVFLHDGNGNMLIQQRAEHKYHSPLLWTNACCSHPLTDHVFEEASVRLSEELGLYDIELKELYTFHYLANVGNGLTENELDHVLIGICTQMPQFDKSEVEDQKYIPFDELLKDVQQAPEKYTVWFRLTVERVIHKIREEESNGN